MKAAYIHIPFCTTICTYCDFTKVFYNEKKVDDYLLSLEKEIKKEYKNDQIKTLYIGGGTPSSLNLKQLEKLLEIIKIFKYKDLEFTFECNIENITKEKLELLYHYKVNRLSIGIQTINSKFLNLLGRQHNKADVFKIINLAKKIGFNNINIDLMYAFPNETLHDLKKDLNYFIKLDVDHISTYSLIIEPNTILYVNKTKNTNEDLDYEMYKFLNQKLHQYGFNNYEISNFSKPNKESKHNLTYWNNEEYYGFGLGASGYIDNIRYTNTKSLRKYLDGTYKEDINILTKEEQIENEWILGLRKKAGLNIHVFKEKYHLSPFNKTVLKLIEEGKLIKSDDNIYINPKYMYISNTILVNFIGINNDEFL